jgi:hypothetical protein
MSHWYKKDGAPQYTVIGANGKERDTTLRDARKLDLVPSVTTILNVAAKPGLNVWLQQQVLMAALTLPRHENEAEEAWIERIIQDSKVQTKDAADRGTNMHDQIEDYFNKKPGDYPDYCKETYFAVVKEFGNQDWITEQSFASDLGFGGKVDLHAKGIVIDFKTKEKVDDKTAVYDEHAMQLAAYRVGLGMPEAICANVFVDLAGNVKIIRHEETEVAKAWDMFMALLSFYRIKNAI